MMAKQKLLLVPIVCLTSAVFTGETLSRRRTPPTLPGAENLRGLTGPEESEMMRKWVEDRHLQERISRHEYVAAMMKHALKNELGASEGQWRVIEAKYERQVLLMCEAWAYGNHRVANRKDFTWRKATEDRRAGFAPPKTAAELTECERNVDELIDLLRREDTTDEELRKQIDSLQQAREKARRELPKAKQELAATLATPRQEAVFLLLGYID